jgi:mRNA interferase HicA
MKYSEFKRWLEQQGVKFIPSRKGSSHYSAVLGDKITTFPFHGAKEIKSGLVAKIKKDLGLQ